jgi:hypothetical protein
MGQAASQEFETGSSDSRSRSGSGASGSGSGAGLQGRYDAPFDHAGAQFHALGHGHGQAHPGHPGHPGQLGHMHGHAHSHHGHAHAHGHGHGHAHGHGHFAAPVTGLAAVRARREKGQLSRNKRGKRSSDDDDDDVDDEAEGVEIGLAADVVNDGHVSMGLSREEARRAENRMAGLERCVLERALVAL